VSSPNVRRPVASPEIRSAVHRLAIARLISVTGGAAAYTALMSTIYDRTAGSPGWLSATLLLTFGVSGLMAPFAGHLGDRFDRRIVMIVAELCGAAAFAAMALVDAPAVLLAFAFVSAIADQPFYAASRAAIPNLVEEESQIAWANSWVSIGVNAGITVGPVVGGVLVHAVGPSWVFGVNALTFLVSVALVWSVRRPFSGARREEDEEEHRGVVAGFRFVRRDWVLRRIVVGSGVMVAGLGLAMVADRPLAAHFGVGDVGFGAIISCWGAGSVVGSFLGRRLTEAVEARWVVLGTAGIALSSLGMGLSPAFWPVLVFVAANGISDAIAIVGEQGIQQRRTPDVVRSRVMAASEAVLSVALAAGYGLAGPVLALTSAQGLYVVAGVGAVVATSIMLPIALRRREATAALPVEG
jgi:MFS family permease